MKSVLFRLLNVSMALMVLLSSMGFGLIEHTCAVRGKRVYSVYESGKTGCHTCLVTHKVARTSASVDRTDCCQNTARYQHVDTNSSLNYWQSL
jgi:hypothetical protein